MTKAERDVIWALGHKLAQKEKNSPLASALHILAQEDEWFEKKLIEWGEADRKQEEATAVKKEILDEVQAALNWLHTKQDE